MFPELAVDVKNVLRRIWSDRMDAQQLENVINEIQSLHKAMKNMIEIVFSSSPIIVLSTHGWESKSYNSFYLLRVGVFLLNYFLAFTNGSISI